MKKIQNKLISFITTLFMMAIMIAVVTPMTAFATTAAAASYTGGSTLSNAVQYFGQSFTATKSGTITSVVIPLRRTNGGINPTATVSICPADQSTGRPSGTPLATSNSDVAITSTTVVNITFNFTNGPHLSSGIKYALVVNEASMQLNYQYTNSSTAYADGEKFDVTNRTGKSPNYNYSTSSPSQAGDMNFTINATLDTYAVTYTAGINGSITGSISQTVDYDGSTSQVTAVSNPGYHFVNWTKGGVTVGTNAVRSDSNVTAATSYTANFAISQYTISFNSNGGSAVISQTKDYGEKFTEPTTPIRTGYTLVGWYSDAGLTSAYDFNTSVSGNISLFAKWNINSYTISTTVDPSGSGTITGGGTYTFGTSVTLTATPEAANKFVNWTDDTGRVLSINPIYKLTATNNITLKAKFAVNQYIVIFQDFDGKLLKTQTVDSGSDAAPPSNPTRVGYTFKGWQGSYTGITSDTTITAIYEKAPIYYTITVNGTGTTGGGTYQANDYVTITAPSTDANGKVFAYWEINSTTVSNSATYRFMATANMTFTPVYADTPPIAVPLITINDQAVITKTSATAGKISWFGQYTVPTGYTFVECGAVLGADNSTNLFIGGSGTATVKLSTAAPNGQYSITLANVATGKTRYAKMYLIYTDSNGTTFTIYSDKKVACTMN